jgi:hypothetical protein
MTVALTHFAPALAVFSGGNFSELAALLNPRADLLRIRGSAAVINHTAKSRIEVSAQNSGTLFKSVPQQASFDEKIFDSLVSLKVAVSQYAMHLPPAERHRIFERLDSVINTEDWHEEDRLPQPASFFNFLKWMIYSKHFDWSSIGVSDDGNILIAWSRPNMALTANFSVENKVTWTAAVETENGPAHAVGTCSLQHFKKQALFYLDQDANA